MKKLSYNKKEMLIDFSILAYLSLMLLKFIGRGNAIWKGYIFVSDPRLSGTDFREFYNYVQSFPPLFGKLTSRI